MSGEVGKVPIQKMSSLRRATGQAISQMRVVGTDQDLDLDAGGAFTSSAENVIMPANMWPSGVMKVNDSSSA